MRWRRPWLGVAILIAVILTASSPGLPVPVAAADGETEVRALWVDAFHDGLKTPAQVERLVADARRANVNTLLVQVRRRGDVTYLGGREPLVPDHTIGFDGLKALLDAAHNGSPRLEVQAWLTVYPVWNSQTSPPADPSHPFNQHGPSSSGDDNWLMLRDDGESWTGAGYWFDPGHPAVSAYVIDLAADLVQRYDLDGVHLDRLRYFEGENVGGGVRDHRWGYNPASVKRFNLENGRAGQPDPNDLLWLQFRRDQVTNLLDRIRQAVLSIRPDLKVSAAVIPWGYGPRSRADWVKTAAYRDAFQDWRAWLERGLLDQAFVMNYNLEASSTEAAMFDSWLSWQREHSYGRQMVAGLGIYRNSPADSVRQLRRALAVSPTGSRLAGVALYSYASPDASRLNDDPADDTPDGIMWQVLTQPMPENEFNPPFAQPRAAPPVPPRG
jgi:uncharacterized lipoprotein YddW (UPF0748 family)